MSQDLTSVFSGVENAKELGGFTSRMGIGSHTLLLKRFQVKESQKGKGKIVEADFLVLESSTTPAGETKGWAWFIGAPGWAGTYEESRLKAFAGVVGASIGDTSPVSAILGAMAGPSQVGAGMMFKCVVSAQTNRDGSPKQSPKGETYTQIEWAAVPQTLEDIQRGRAHLGTETVATPAPAPAPVAQQAAPAPAPAPAAVAGNNSMSALLGALKKV
jgi:hypothetical protein